MKYSRVSATILAVLLAAVNAQDSSVYTYQTLSNGQVQLATGTYSSVASQQSRSSSGDYTYTLNRDDLAYPTYSPYPSNVAEAAAAPNLPNATTFAQEALGLIFLAKNANSTNCAKCQAVMIQAQDSARADPEFIGRISTPFCESIAAFVPLEVCVGLLRIGSTDVGAIFGSYGTDMLATDGQVMCAFLFGLCDLPSPPTLDLTELFNGTTKPAPQTLSPSSKEPLKVLHISDYHLDPRFVVGAEANCTGAVLGTVCCRVYPYTNLSQSINQPASIFGDYRCDTPEPLATSVFRAVPNVTGHQWSDFAFGIFTGDLVSHDIWELTPEYVTANELISYQQFFDGMGGVPVYPTLGNHDTFPQGFTAFPSDDIFLSANASYATQQEYNFQNVSAAWEGYGWLTAEEAQQVVNTGLGIYRARTAANDFDPTGIFRTLADMLLEAEQNNEPVWLIQHVNTGGSVSFEALPAASDTFYQIVDRFNNTIRATFFGHTHNDEFGVFYTYNGTFQNTDTAASVAYIGPSVTPYTNLNAGFRYYLVDANTFAVIDSINYYANVSNADEWDREGDVTWEFEYSARATYDPDGALLGGVDSNTPLTPAFWHQVADRIKNNDTWFRTYTDLRNKLARPYAEPGFSEQAILKCGLTSMSVPIFETCLGSMQSITTFL